PGRAAGRHQQDGAGRGRDDPADPLEPRLELLRRPEEQEERVMSQGGLERLIGGLVTVAKRLQTHPPEPVAGRERLAREMLDEFDRTAQAATPNEFGRADQAAWSRLLLLHDSAPHQESGRSHHRRDHAAPRGSWGMVGASRSGFLEGIAARYAILADI